MYSVFGPSRNMKERVRDKRHFLQFNKMPSRQSCHTHSDPSKTVIYGVLLAHRTDILY